MSPKTSFTGNREFWQRHFVACAKSGLSQKQYCAEHGLTHANFTYAKYQAFKVREAGIRSNQRDQANKFLVPLKIANQLDFKDSAVIKVTTVSGLMLQIPVTTDARWAGEFIKGLTD